MKPPNTKKLTKTTAKSAQPPVEGTPAYKRGYSLTWDDDIKGFGLLTTRAGVKSYIVRARINGKERRHTLGRANVLSTEKARELARVWLGKICEGRDPVAEQHRAVADGVTLRQAFERYLTGKLAARTQELVRRGMSTLSSWLDMPLTKIDGGMVERRHRALSEDTPGAATVAFRYFRAAWNRERIQSKDATGDYLLPPCPTITLSEKKLWNRHTRRQRAIALHRMKDWFDAVDSLPDPKARAFFKFCLLTGCRRDEAARLTWADTGLIGRSVIFRNTKAGKHHADPDHHLPLPAQLVDTLQELKAASVGEYVFGDDLGRYRGRGAFTHDIGRIIQCYGDFGPHDLRRTFASIAEILNVPSLTLKKLLNHSTAQDVTGGYVVATLEGLRGPIQRIADQIDAYRNQADNVTAIRQKQG
jgi:integrase